MAIDGFDPAASEETEAVAEVVRQALDRDATWSDLAEAGLLSLVVPEEYGGEGLGLTEVALILTGVGERGLGLPVWETLAVGAPVLAAVGSEEQKQRWLPGVASGEVRFAVALREPGAAFTDTPSVTLTDGRLTGRKIGVSGRDGASVLLVSAVQGGSPVLALVAADAEGMTTHESPVSRGLISGEVEHTVVFDGTPAQVLPGANAVQLANAHAVAGLTVLAAGLLSGARDMTADYIKGRKQFGRSLAEFQAVSMQIADVYVASRLMTLAADNAVWRVTNGLDAADDLAVAAYWVAAEATVALHICHHLHGGMGVDETYPLHLYYSRIKDIAQALGGEAATLEAVHVEGAAAKNLELTVAQRALKAEVRDYFAGLNTHDEHQEIMRDRHGPAYHKTIKKMGADGWMGVGWPKEYGGRGLGEVEQTIFANEAQYADVHLPSVTLQTVGPTLQTYGTDLQKEKFLGPILAGDLHFAIGYSEPDAGTDLASLRTTAKRVGDEYIVNGQKMWTTGGHAADYIWLAVRTDSEAPKHKGISILIVDTKDPGFSSTPIITADGAHHVNATYYNDVRVPVEMLVGEENQGWRLLTTQLNHERVMLGPAGRIEGLRDRVVRWAEAAGVLDKADVQAALGYATANFRVNELLNWEVARAAETGALSVADASASKVFATERVQTAGRLLADVVARYGDPGDPATADLAAYLDAQSKRNLVLTFGGGVNEVQKELIGMFGLQLPRVPR